jgi:hypothetical protein
LWYNNYKKGGGAGKMREIVEHQQYAFENIYQQLESIDFKNIECSPLINGAPGLGKTTACCSPPMYELYCKKLEKSNVKVLVVESRSMTRDQKKYENTNPNIHFKQFAEVSQMVKELNFLYDIIILDEAHSLFSDSEFAASATAPICDWLLNHCRIFQIYITASDIEFIKFAEKYFNGKEFLLTFSDVNKVYVKYLAQKMILSVNTIKTEKVIEKKEKTFFNLKERGVFFILSAKEAYSLYDKYNSLGFSCGFYISQKNSSQIIKHEELEEEDIESYTSQTWTTDIFTMYQKQENERARAGLPTIRESIQKSCLPADIQFLFITDAGQEGISLNCENNLSFIFIEDTYPLKINQKLFRYRENVPLVYISIPRRRLERAYSKSMERVIDMMSWSQEKLEGYYLGARAGKKVKDAYANLIWYDKINNEYRVAENYIAFLLTASEEFRAIRDILDNNEELFKRYGQYARICERENLREVSVREKIVEFLEDYKDKELDKDELESVLEKLKKIGLTNKKGEKKYGVTSFRKYLESEEIGELISKRKKIRGKLTTIYSISFLNTPS